MDGVQTVGFGSTADAALTDGAVRTFWRFVRKPTVRGGVSFDLLRLADFKNGTATTVPTDWFILYREAHQLVIDASRHVLTMKDVKSIAPNLDHWSTADEIEELLDQSSGNDDGDENRTKYLDRLGRRKRIPLKDHVDEVMADRLGLRVETIRSYRQRAARPMK